MRASSAWLSALIPLIILPAAGCSSGVDPTPWVGGCEGAGATGLVFVPSDCATLSEAAQYIVDGGTIDVSRGVYPESVSVGAKTLIFRTREGSGSVVVDAAGEPSALSVEGGDVTVVGFALSGASSHAISVVGGSLTLEGVDVRDNSGSAGVGLYLEGSAAEVTESTFQRGAASSHGAGVVAVDSTLTLTDSQLLDNDANGGPGAALYLTGSSSVRVDGGVISGNSGGTAGAIAYSACEGAPGLDIEGASLEGNVITSGPAFYLEGGGFTLAGADFDGLSEGVVAGSASDVVLRRVSITGSGDAAGVPALDLTLSGGSFTDVDFIGNTGPEGAMRIRADGTGELILNRVLVQGNTSPLRAGGLYLTCGAVGAPITLTEVEVSGNVVEAGAGGMRVEQCAVSGGTFSENTGTFGGGVGMLDGASLSQAVVRGNTSLDSGGGVHVGAPSGERVTVSLDHVWIEGNTTAELGGGLNVRSAPVEVRNAVFLDNTARLGGDVYVFSTTLLVEHSAVIGGEATGGPAGGIYQDGGTLTLRHDLFTGNLSANPDRHNVFVKGGAGASAYCIYDGDGNDGVENLTVGATDVQADPRLVGPADGVWTFASAHLALGSPAIDAGNPQLKDADGGPADIGPFGGPDGGSFDLDGDGLPGWFWPGAFATPPSGVSASGYDCDDLDPDVSCEG